MKRLIFSLHLVFFALCVSAQTQHSIDKFFAQMPQAVLPILDRTARLDMIDLFNNGLLAKVENTYGGQSEMLRKTDEYIFIRCTDASTWQMRLLTLPHDTLIVCIHSFMAQGTSSQLSVYKRDWHATKHELPTPIRKLMLNPNSKLSYTRSQILQMTTANLPIQVIADADSPTLTYSLSLDALTEQDRKDAEDLFLPLVYRWLPNGKWSRVTANTTTSK